MTHGLVVMASPAKNLTIISPRGAWINGMPKHRKPPVQEAVAKMVATPSDDIEGKITNIVDIVGGLIEMVQVDQFRPGTIQPSPVKLVPIELDGKTYQLRLTLWTIKLIEDETEENILTANWDFKDYKSIIRYLKYALQENHPEVTEEQLYKTVDLSQLGYIADRLTMLWGLSMPDPEPSTGADSKN